MDIATITEYVKPELLVLVPVLYFLGMMLKGSSYVKDKLIPLLLVCISILLCLCYIAGTGCENAFSAVFAAVTQGILTAGAAVYVNELFKQVKKDE